MFLTGLLRQRGGSVAFSRLNLALLLATLLAGCAMSPSKKSVINTAQTSPKSTFSPPQAEQINLSQVPFFPQEKYQCGPAALATVLSHQGVQVQPADLTDRVYLPEQQGTLPLEMVSTGRSYGFLAYRLEPELNHLLLQLESGYPVLVFQNLGLESLPQWHFAVVVGYDLREEILILRSSTYREYRVDFSTFRNTWLRAKGWAYLFLKPGEMPVQADPLRYLQASLDLVEVGLSVSGQKALEQGVHRWPQLDAMRLALSNTYFHSGLFDQASDILLASPSLGESGNIWNNIAYIQMARQCYTSAFDAVQCAVTLSPEDANIQHSLKDILSKSDRQDGGQSCPQLKCPKPVEGF